MSAEKARDIPQRLQPGQGWIGRPSARAWTSAAMSAGVQAALVKSTAAEPAIARMSSAASARWTTEPGTSS